MRTNESLISLVFSPVRPEVYVARSDSILTIDTAARTIRSGFPVDERPGGITISSDGEQLYVAYPGISLVAVFDLAGRLLTTIPVGQDPRSLITSVFK